MRRKTRAGLTIVELVVYIGVMTLALVSIVALLANATDIMARVKQEKEVRTSALVALERIERAVKSADEVVENGSQLGSHPGTLELLLVNESGTPEEVRFTTSEGDLIVYRGDAPQGSLLSDSVSVDEFVVYRSEHGFSHATRIELTISHDKNPDMKKSFYTTAVPRGVY